MELGGDEVYVEEFLLPLRWVRAEVFIVCHSLAEARGDTIQDDIDQVVVGQLGIDIVPINIVPVFLDGTCLLEIPDLIKSPVWLIVVAIVFLNSILDLFLSIEPMLVGFPPFQCISFCT